MLCIIASRRVRCVCRDRQCARPTHSIDVFKSLPGRTKKKQNSFPINLTNPLFKEEKTLTLKWIKSLPPLYHATHHLHSLTIFFFFNIRLTIP